MALQIGELYATLGIDVSKFEKGLDSAQGKASKFGGILQTALGFVAGGVITKGLDIVGGAIGGIADAMINGNAEFEKYETQFGVLLGSTDEAKKRLGELAKFGANTPFELPELVSADKVLTSFGIHSQDMLTIVGDVAAGTGTSFEEMALNMGKFSAGATGEALARFQELGIATKQELAAMGIEFDKAGSMITPVAEAMPILEQLMKDKFGGMMDAQSQTFGGMVSNLQDWFGQTGRIIGQPLFEVLKDKLEALLEFLSSPDVQAAITTFAQVLADGIAATIDFISNTVIPAFSIAWSTLSPIIAAVIPIIQQVISAFSSGGQSASGIGSVIEWLKGVWQSLQPVVQAATNLINTIVTATFTAIATFLRNNGDDIQSFIKTAWTQIQQIVDIAVKLINATIVPIFNGIASFIGTHGDQIQRILTNTWNAIKAIIDAALTLIKGVLTAALQIIQGDWEGAWNTIKEMSARIVQDLWTVIKSGLDNILTIFGTSFDEVVGIITGLPDRVSSVGSDLVEGIRQGFANSWDSFVSWVIGRLDGLKDQVLSFFGIQSPSKVMADEVGGPLVEGIMMGMDEMFPQLLMLLSGYEDDILSKAESIADKVNSMLANIVDKGLSGGANLDRERAKTIDDLEKFRDDANKLLEKNNLNQYQRDIIQTQSANMEGMLNDLAAQAAKIAETDPERAAAFYKQRKAQIFELAKLQNDFAMATDNDERARIIAKMRLIEDAQRKETELSERQQNRQDDQQVKQFQDISKAIGELFSKIDLGEAGDKLIQLFTNLTQFANALNGGVINGPVVLPPPPSMNMPQANQPNLTINQYITQAGTLIDEAKMALAYYNSL